MTKLSAYEETAKRFQLKKNERFCLKLTTAKGVSGRIAWIPLKSRNLLFWGEGVSYHKKSSIGKSLLTNKWIHAYPNLTEMLRYMSDYFTGYNVKRYGWILWLAKGNNQYQERPYVSVVIGFKHLTTLVKLARGRTHSDLIYGNYSGAA